MTIKPLQLGETHFPHNIIQGPLAGVSTAPFRALAWQYGQPAFSCTEMISCKSILHQSAASLERFVQTSPKEGPVCFQLSGSDPHELAEATKRVTAMGANLIDLNCGCPVKKIRSKGAGSSLLSSASKLYQLIQSMKQSTSLPVSVKIRVDGGSDEKFNHEVADAINDAGVDYLIVHGRHWTEHYETACRYDEIAYFVERMRMPVIGNGDVACVSSLKKMLETGCAGVMIGRAGVGQPWLVQKLIAEMRGEVFVLPTLQAVATMFVQHVSELAILLGSEKFALLQARKLAKYYARRVANRQEFCDKMNVCERLEDLQMLCGEYFHG